MSPVRRLWLAGLYYASWLWFGLGGLLLNVVCLPLLLAPRRERLGPGVRLTIHLMFSLWAKWHHASRVMRVEWRGFDHLPRGVVYVANHPCLIDAPLLLARLPETVSLFKTALLRNPVIGPAAILAGYVPSSEDHVELVREGVQRINAGQSLLIFPEGTRTADGTLLGPLKPGFALIAARANCPIQLVTIRTSPGLTRRGQPWWRVPPLPAWMEFTLGQCVQPEPMAETAVTTARVESLFRQSLQLETVSR